MILAIGIRGLAILLITFSVLLTSCGDEHPSVPVVPENNHPPLLQLQADTLASLGQALELQARATDPDGDELSFRIVVKLSWAEVHYGPYPDVEIDQQTGRFQFVPKETDIPGRDFVFRVSDGEGGEDSTAFHVAVTR